MIFWAAGTVVVSVEFLGQPTGLVLLAVGLSFIFLLVNGISDGISDWNPLSSAFVVTIFIMAGAGLKDAGVGLICGAIVLVACSVGVDMQQDRSTGWRLGTNRVNQFRYQVAGILVGSALAVALAGVFLRAYPVAGRNIDFVFDAVIFPSPYASSFGGFVTLAPTIWFATGGVITAIVETRRESRQRRDPKGKGIAGRHERDIARRRRADRG